MTKTLCSLSTLLFLFVLSTNASAHSGHGFSFNSHSIMHLIISASVAVLLIAVGYFMLKRLPKGVKQKIRK